MSLDEMNLDSGDGVSSSSESSAEKSEQQRESSRRAQAQLQKTKKDEKKAKSDNDELFIILSRFIKNPLYEDLFVDITILLQNNFPSRFLLVIIALIYPEASYYLLEKTDRKEDISLLHSLHRYSEGVEFHNDTIDQSLRNWITLWMTASEQFLTSEETSVILTQKLSTLLVETEGAIASKSLAKVFQFFFRERNVFILIDKAQTYSDFILSQIRTSLEAALLHMDSDLKEKKEISERDLFGI